jgi:N-acetyl sugar amidotransferase
MQRRDYQICTRCVMDTSDPFITFDDAGQCNHCTDFLANRRPLIEAAQRGEETLAALLDTVKARGRGRKYDCVIGVSGGVDSSYVLMLAHDHGLRTLAVHLDNGWNSPVAAQNIRTLATAMKVDYASHVLPWNDFRQVQRAFLQASVPEAETPTDVAIVRAVHHHALKHGVKAILSGGNIASEGILPVSWHYNARDTRYSHAILDAANCPRRLFRPLRFGVADEFYAKIVRGIRTLYPLNHVRYDKAAARAALEQRYGWTYYGSKHGESRFTRFIQTYYLVVKHGIDYRRATLSSELLLGHVERDEALAILATSPFDPQWVEGEIDYLTKKLAMSRTELEAVIAAPARYYVDYPNQAALLGRIYDAYRRLKGQPKTSNF